MESVTGSLGDLGGGLVPDMAEPSAPIPSGVGLEFLVSKMETKKQIINLIRFVSFFSS